METVHIEWVGVVAAIVVQMLFGAIWYAPPVFGKRWAALHGKSYDDLKPEPPTLAFGVVGSLVSALLLATILDWAGVDDVANAALLGLKVGLGTVGFGVLVADAFEKRPRELSALNAGSETLRFVLAAITLSLFQ